MNKQEKERQMQLEQSQLDELNRREVHRQKILDGVILEASPDAFEMHEATIFELNRQNRHLSDQQEAWRTEVFNLRDQNERWRVLCHSLEAHNRRLRQQLTPFHIRFMRWIRRRA